MGVGRWASAVFVEDQRLLLLAAAWRACSPLRASDSIRWWVAYKHVHTHSVTSMQLLNARQKPRQPRPPAPCLVRWPHQALCCQYSCPAACVCVSVVFSSQEADGSEHAGGSKGPGRRRESRQAGRQESRQAARKQAEGGAGRCSVGRAPLAACPSALPAAPLSAPQSSWALLRQSAPATGGARRRKWRHRPPRQHQTAVLIQQRHQGHSR